ncbi:helix-turn-helix transcriptional regulator [Leptotrichia shahii]|uniref:helix-turn-helix domain-containing protein n=1 Tax=Leptotrichia shahii TaxID=157691 RepID=UPI0028D562FD|nr:helix-turn-helix transcriptional regulator [Leptotrichia shahii]
MKINEIIKKRRKDLGLTLKQVADQLGVSESLISRYESNDVKNMKVDKIAPLAKILKTTPAYLMGWEDNPTPPKPTVDTSMLTEAELAEFEKITGVNQQLFFNGVENDHDMDVFKEAVLNIILANRKDKKD